ncbi:MAG: hypothetical protein FWE36_08210, partial [Erysipelotrichales bacterium]|nr:hypothetical protein [Erysipelotrichales bacterium]
MCKVDKELQKLWTFFDKVLTKKIKEDAIADSFQESLDKILLNIFPKEGGSRFVYSSRALVSETLFILLETGISKQDFNIQTILNNLES